MNKKFIVIFIIIFFSNNFSQVVFVPVGNNIYLFLERMDIKFHFLNEQAKPFSRKKVSDFLQFLNKKRASLNVLEKENLDFYLKEFSTNDGYPEVNWKLFKKKENNFSFVISPIIRIGSSFNGKDYGYNYSWGGYLWGSFANWFAASLNFSDNGEYGTNVNEAKFFTPETGHWNNQKLENGIEFSDVRGSISFNWSWGNISLVKDYFTFGNGEFGQLIHSTKAPSYPHIRLELRPTEWFSFYYIHGWLTSLVDDSVYFFPTGLELNGDEVYRKKYVNKYIALNYALFKPFNWFNIGLGNSVIYDREIRLEFLIPFLLYKFQDHNMGLNNDYGSNGQLFLDFAFYYKQKYKVYSSIFIDNASIREIENGDLAKTWTGITLGFYTINFIQNNLDIKIEYTRINPWVYEHYIPTITYKHINFELGHWIGQNADLFTIQFSYQLLRGLTSLVSCSFSRKGGLLSSENQYDHISEEFLYGKVRNDRILEISLRYELFHNLLFKGGISYSDISDKETSRTPAYLLGNKLNGYLNFVYGL